MTRPSLHRIIAGTAVAGLVALAATPAFAFPRSFPFSSVGGGGSGQGGYGQGGNGQGGNGQGGNGQGGSNQANVLAFIQKAADAAINGRVNMLSKVISDLNNVPQSCNVGGLITTAQTDISNLNSLESTINSDTTVQQARMDAQKIFTEFRVYALVVPVDEMVVAACRIGDVATKVESLVQNLQGVNDPNIEALLTNMVNEAQAAQNAVNGLAATLEGYTPSDWNANHKLLITDRGDLRTARQDLEKCRQDAHEILEIVRHDLNLGGNGGNSVNQNQSTSTTSSTVPTTSSTVPTTSTTAAG